MAQEIEDWFPVGGVIDADQGLFPRFAERLGLTFIDGTRQAVTFHEADDREIRVIGIVDGRAHVIRWSRIESIIYFDRPRH